MSTRRASSSRTGRSRASRSRRVTSCSRARASSWRRPATTARSRSSASSAPRWSRWSSRTTASTSTRSQARSARATSSTRSRPSRTRAGARSRSRTAGASSTSRPTGARPCSRTTPTGCSASRATSIPRLFELSEGSTIFLSSFSKTVAPGIRTGYLILPEELVPAIEELVLSNYVSPAIFVEAALLEFLTSGRFEPNLETVRDGLRIRRDAMLAALAREMPEGTALEPARGRLLPLARPAERGRGRHASRPRRRGGRRLHQGRRLLLPRRRGGSGAARVLLRHRTRDRRGHHPPRAARARSGCRCGLTAAP